MLNTTSNSRLDCVIFSHKNYRVYHNYFVKIPYHSLFSISGLKQNLIISFASKDFNDWFIAIFCYDNDLFTSYGSCIWICNQHLTFCVTW
ncbi:hypothetical protein [Yersinia phage PY54]|uniref:hypothetical protein n=1 Tax=Yersinia phage PY54 TaxID=172667 RepID=UPI00001B9852|nr:hypothetical protein PY54p37 [Yersinia phage PY54]CAD91798.1 hypothetical protein [Yersinia phage PY54]